MQKKPKFRWLDTQIGIASAAVVATLGVWNLIAAAARTPVLKPIATRMAASLSPTPPPTATPMPPPTATPAGLTVVHLPPLHLLLGGKLPPPPQVVVVSASSATSHNSSGGGSSSQPSNPPPPVTSTKSSHP